MALLKFKRSAVSGKAPTLTDLELGELAINTFDGKVYMRKDNGTASIIEVGGGSGVLSFNTRTGAVTLSSGDVTTALGYTPANKAGDTFTGNVTVQVGTSNIFIAASDGAIEMTRAAGGAYIDLKNSTGEDFDCRIQESGGLLNVANGLRTNIYYDIDNTAYYVDPASTSVINGLNVGTAQPIFSNGNFQYHYHQSPHIAYVKKTGGYSWYWRRNDTGLSGGANEVEDMSLTEDGNLFARSSVRAPIFYDSNNTAYYIDPNAGSNVLGDFRINQNGAAGIQLISTTGTQSLWIRTGYDGAPTPSVSATNVQFQSSGSSAGTFTFWSGNTLALSIGGDSATGAGSIRAPIFYDSNNTAFYVDPATGSSLSGATFSDLITGRSSPSTDVNTANDTGSISIRGSTTTVASMSFHRTGAYAINMGLGTDNVFRIGGWSAQSNCLQVFGSGAVQALNDFRAPIFYDSNNTGYYIDPNNTSNIYRLASYTAAQYNSGDWNAAFQNTPAQSYAWHGDISSGGPSGTWWFYESMRHSNASNYWGTQVAWGWEDNSLRMMQRNVSNGGYSAWAEYLNTSGRTYNGNLTMTGSIISSSSDVRAPIFYDQNDTGYYVDPNGNTRLRNLNLGGGGGFDATIHIVGIQGGNGRLTQMSPNGASQAGFNIISARNGSNADLWWSWGVNTDNTWRCNAGVGYNGSAGFTLDASGNFTAGGNVTAYSDARLKKDVETIGDALGLVRKMRGVTYTRIDTDKAGIGVIAQEMLEVVPEVVQHGTGDDDTLSVAYGNLVGVLIEAIKELTNKVETLEAHIRSK